VGRPEVTVTTALDTTTVAITDPGVYDLPADVYHADPVPPELGGSLSSSGAKLLLPPSCPAIYDWQRRNGEKHTDAFDFGHAAHAAVLGAGADTVIIDADDWRSKAARDAKAVAYAEGKTPLLAKDAAVVDAMAGELRAHPIASALLDPDHGQPERSLFTRDPDTGVWLRGMFDWLPNPGSGRYIIPDYKTVAGNGDPAAFARSMADYRYHGQAAWYLDLVRALGIADDPAFVFIVQSKVAPYLVSVIEPDAEAIDVGRTENRAAIDLYATCTANDEWPAWGDGVLPASLPPWYTPRIPKDTP
jgi:hypothetical protein